MSGMDDLHLAYNTSPICPHCGHAHADAFEWPDDGVHECDRCDKPFNCSRDVEVSYSTWKVTP